MFTVKEMLNKYLNEEENLEDEKEAVNKSNMQAIQDQIKLKEAELRELKTKLSTLRTECYHDYQDDYEDSYDDSEYNQEGDMAKTQLQKASNAIDTLKSMLSNNENLPEWVQSKITLASTYLDTAADYIKSTEQRKNDESDYEKDDMPMQHSMPRKISPFKVKPIQLNKRALGFSIGGGSAPQNDYNDEM